MQIKTLTIIIGSKFSMEKKKQKTQFRFVSPDKKKDSKITIYYIHNSFERMCSFINDDWPMVNDDHHLIRLIHDVNVLSCTNICNI